MKRNIVQRHAIFFTLLVLCFLIVPAIRESYAQDRMNKKEAQRQQKLMEEYQKQQKQKLAKEKQQKQKAAKFKVMLDAGHGGYDAGSESKQGKKKKKEKDITLSITLKTGELLKQEGVQVLYTRESDTISWKSNNVDDLNTRSHMANASQADIFVSIHTNYSDEAKDKTAGSEVWYSTRQSGSKKIAEHMELALRTDGYTKSRGLRDDRESFLSLLYYNQIPSILVETGFISNPKDVSILSDAKGQERIAQAISTGVLKALGLKN